MALFDDPTSLLPGLLPAAFRGIPFWVVDARQSIGRRIVTTFFPGTDLKTHDDLGLLEGPIDVRGFVIGDDYVAQARALAAAFRTPGPATFLHPWLGEHVVVLARPADISFDVRELRVARISAEFDPVTRAAPAVISTLAAVLDAVGLLTTQARLYAAAILGASPLAMASWAAGREAARAAAAVVVAAAGRSTASAAITLSVSAASSAIDTVDAAPTRQAAAQALGAALVALPVSIGLAYRIPATPAIGPSAEADVTSDPEPRTGALMLVAIASEIAALRRDSLTETAALLSAEAGVLAEAVRTAADIPFESRQEAISWRLRLEAALAGLDGRVAATAPVAPSPAAQLWRAIASVRAALASDINEVIGRLPSVRVITPPRTISAFLIAQDLAGDEPRAVVPMVDDIVRRNRLRHPGTVRPSPIEVLSGSVS